MRSPTRSSFPRRRWRSGSVAPSARCKVAGSPNPAIWRSCFASCHSCTTPATVGGTTWPTRRSVSPANSRSPRRSRRPAGCLALLMLQHARLPARTDAGGHFVPLDEQDRSLWNSAEIEEAVAILQGALGEQRRGRYQVQAAIAALHSDARSADETDWTQILEWYDELIAFSDDPDHEDPAAVLNRAVAVGHVMGASGRPRRDRTSHRGARRSPAMARRPRLLARDGRRVHGRGRRIRSRRRTSQRQGGARSPHQEVSESHAPGHRSVMEEATLASGGGLDPMIAVTSAVEGGDRELSVARSWRSWCGRGTPSAIARDHG